MVSNGNLLVKRDGVSLMMSLADDVFIILLVFFVEVAVAVVVANPVEPAPPPPPPPYAADADNAVFAPLPENKHLLYLQYVCLWYKFLIQEIHLYIHLLTYWLID